MQRSTKNRDDILAKLGGPELSFEISEAGEELDDIIRAVAAAFPGWKFNRTEARYESCLMAIFERRTRS